MIKIRTYLFELVCGFIFVFECLLLFYFFIAILTIINHSNINVFIISSFVLLIVFLILLIIVLISIMISGNSKKNIIINDNVLFYNGEKYNCSELSFKYYSCKWYAIPFFYIYKAQQGGLVEIYFNSEEVLVSKIFYIEYVRLTKVIKNYLVV